MVEHYLGIGLEKGHSAADWSTRPLPHDWLVYAALDVELLIPLRGRAGRPCSPRPARPTGPSRSSRRPAPPPPPPPRVDPWRRTSGIHSVRSRRQLAAIRALWQSRDELAAQRDIAPGRILPDAAIVDAARKNPKSVDELVALPIFGGTAAAPPRRPLVRRAAARPSSCPTTSCRRSPAPSPDALPPSGRWRERAPEAAARLAACREVVAALAEQHDRPGPEPARLRHRPPAGLGAARRRSTDRPVTRRSWPSWAPGRGRSSCTAAARRRPGTRRHHRAAVEPPTRDGRTGALSLLLTE